MSTRTGRRPGETQTREELLAIAVRQFAENGYQRTSLRAITAEAGVDPTLIRHFFGGKEGLFREAVLQQVGRFDALRHSIADAAEDEIGARFVDAYLDIWEVEPSASLTRALVRTAFESEVNRRFLQDTLSHQLPKSVAMVPAIRDLESLLLAASHLLGLCIVRHITCLEPLASMDRSELVTQVAPLIQRVLTRSEASVQREV